MKNGIKTRGNGQGCAIKVRTNNWKAIVVVGYHDAARTKPIRRTKSGFATKADALDYIPTLRREKKSKATLAELYSGWSTSAMMKLSESQKTKLSYAKNRLTEIWNIDISLLTIEDLQNCVDKNANSFYPARDMKVLLSHLYNRACAQQNVVNNLAKFIELPTLQEKEQTPFTLDEINIFWQDLGNGNLFTGYILLMIYSGMMPGELMDCKKDMIDFDKQIIFGCGKKTKKRRNTPIVIADVILPVLEELVASTEGEKLLPYDKTTFYDIYAKTLERCGIKYLPPYSCRHTTATVLSNIENNVTVIQEIMRHSKFQTTEHYIHKDTTPMLEAINKIGRK